MLLTLFRITAISEYNLYLRIVELIFPNLTDIKYHHDYVLNSHHICIKLHQMIIMIYLELAEYSSALLWIRAHPIDSQFLGLGLLQSAESDNTKSLNLHHHQTTRPRPAQNILYGLLSSQFIYQNNSYILPIEYMLLNSFFQWFIINDKLSILMKLPLHTNELYQKRLFLYHNPFKMTEESLSRTIKRLNCLLLALIENNDISLANQLYQQYKHQITIPKDYLNHLIDYQHDDLVSVQQLDDDDYLKFMDIYNKWMENISLVDIQQNKSKYACQAVLITSVRSTTRVTRSNTRRRKNIVTPIITNSTKLAALKPFICIKIPKYAL